MWSLEVTEELNRSGLNKCAKERVRERVLECAVCRVFYSEKDKGQTDRKKVQKNPEASMIHHCAASEHKPWGPNWAHNEEQSGKDNRTFA